MKVGSNLRIIRDKQNITQQEMADFLGIDCRTYKRWENGETKVDCELIPKIAEFLHVEICDLFKGKPSDVVVNQNENKECLINAGVFLLINDKEAVNNIADVIKKIVKKQ